MRIAAGVITWRDGDELLIRCLNSVGPFVDELVLVDGLLAGIATDLPAWTPLDRFENAGVHVERIYGATQARKRNVLLGAARRLRCDWLLQIDADERLENGELLRPFLAACTLDAFPIPFQYSPAVLRPLAWKCLRVERWREVISCNGYMSDRQGRLHDLSAPGTIAAAVLDGLPWISHHPDERTGARAELRLGPIEHELEPAPAGALPLPPVNFRAPRLLQPARPLDANGGTMTDEASDTKDAAADTYYCPECGARYGGPGQCENGHPAADVREIAVDAAAEQAAKDGGQAKVDETAKVEGPAPAPADDQAKVETAAGATTRCKFRCGTVIDNGYGGKTVSLNAAYAPDDPESENGKFWTATPSGLIQLQVNNPDGAAVFETGVDYYVDFTRADGGAA